jgi:hypothetical protein
MKPNGWQRLWIVVSVLYLVAVLAIGYLNWPTFERTWHQDDFIAQMPEEARKHVVASYPSKFDARDDRSSYVRAVMPNGAVLVIRGTVDPRLATARTRYLEYKKLSDAELAPVLRAKSPEYADLLPDSFVADEDMDKTVNAYGAVLERATRAARWSFGWHAALAWVIPCALLYVLGWAVAWVRRGFRQSVIGGR